MNNKQAKYAIIVQIYLQLIFKTLGNTSKTMIYVLRQSYISVKVT